MNAKHHSSPPPIPDELRKTITEEVEAYCDRDTPLTETEMADLFTEYITDTADGSRNATVITDGESEVYTRIRRGSKLDIALFSASFNTAIVTVGEQPDKDLAWDDEEPGEYFGKLYGFPVEDTDFPYVPLMVVTYSEDRTKAVNVHEYMEQVLDELADAPVIDDPFDIAGHETRQNAYDRIDTLVENWADEFGSLPSMDEFQRLGEFLGEYGDLEEIEIQIPPEKVGEEEEDELEVREEVSDETDLSEEEKSALESFASQQEVKPSGEEEEKEEMYYDHRELRKVSPNELADFIEQTNTAFLFDPLERPDGVSVDEVDEDVFVEVFGYPHRQSLVPVLVATTLDGEDAVDRLNIIYSGLSINCNEGERAFLA